MDFADQILALSARIPKQLDHILTEEATKNALILPFINALGYNVFDPTEVVPEFTADHGIKKGEKVDYAIYLSGKPVMLFECKHAGADLNPKHASQLFRYFAVTEARVGVLTNGILYRFFSDLEEPNKMDDRPFLEFNILDPGEGLLAELKKLTKATFDINELLSSAHELKYTKAIKSYLADQWTSPAEDFVKFLTKQVYDGIVTQSVREQFTGIVRRAIHQFVNERIQGRLTAALREEDGQASATAALPGETSSDGAVVHEKEVVTTDEEMEGFYIVRAILRQVVDGNRVVHRDVKSYFGVLLDDNNRKPLCRLRFNTSQKYLGLFDNNREEERVPIDSIDEIYDYAKRIKAAVKLYEEAESSAA